MNTRVIHRRVLCVWLPNWPVQRVQAAEPQLASSPLILSRRDARRGILVAAVNLAARQTGIRPGMRLTEAMALVQSVVREHELDEDMEELCALAEQAQQFSPLVGLEQLDKKLWAGRTSYQPECILLDITGLAGLFGGEVALLESVAQWLTKQGYFAHMGIAGTVGAAWGLANYAARGNNATEIELSHTVPFIAREADIETDVKSETRKDSSEQPIATPRCRYCISGYNDGMLESLPLAALRIDYETIVPLQRLAIRTIGELTELPRDGLATRLGERLIRRLDEVLGIKEEPIVTLYHEPEWTVEQSLEIPTDRRDSIEELLRRQCQELCQRLGRRGQGALRLLCRLDMLDHPPLLLQLGLFRPSNETPYLVALLAGQLEQQLRTTRLRPIWRLTLQATLTAELVWRQTDLFHLEEAKKKTQVARLVDNLSSRLGRKQVLAARVQREAQPELAYSLQPLTGMRADGRPQETVRKLSSRVARHVAQPSRDDPLRRPLQLLACPLEISVAGVWQKETSEAPENERTALATAPQKLLLEGIWQTTIEAAGPERLESGWWKGPSIRRDYYRIVTERGWWWIFRDLNQGKWFLHGLFD